MASIAIWSSTGRSYICRCTEPAAKKRRGLCLNCYRRQYPRVKSKKCPVKDRDYKLRSRYGINTDQYGEMLVAQTGRCAICQTPADEYLVLHVDHCHKSGQIRQLLCHQCNTLLGMCGDNVAILEQAIAYLERHRDRT